MLKALELIGFKSFADRTRLEFPSGITAVVGPNGSGKSNVVDAIKWVLGEQSVKSLRGREMTDVIFNGSGTRRPMNSAEITLFLDNADGRLAFDTPEVLITRRVYRSGEGEYLLNRQPCRLRDIRNLLFGTGMGTEAYSVIEQGKVDAMLQASARDRRLIFEEAAGISRFRTKKAEAMRRLERVDQNLLRLSDIVEEVESRLRGVRAQAGKARRYKEYSDRLQMLRTQAAAMDWRRLTDRLEAFEKDAQTALDERNAAEAEVETFENQLADFDRQTKGIDEALRASDARIADDRAQIAASESAAEHEFKRLADLEQEIGRFRRQLAAMNIRADDLQQEMAETVHAVEAAELDFAATGERLAQTEERLAQAIAALDAARAEDQQCRATVLEQVQTTAALGKEIAAVENRIAAAQSARQRAEKQSAELTRQSESLKSELDLLRRTREELTRELERREEQLGSARARLAALRQQQSAAQNDLAQLRERLSGVAERAAVLDELEQRQEGLSSGVKDVLVQAKTTDGPLSKILGIVADLLCVGVEIAPLIEAILGPKSLYVVAPKDPALFAFLESPECRFSGRVGFAWCDAEPTAASASPDLEGAPGVLGRVDRFVEAAPEFAPIVERLLGQTWIVENLAQAMELSAGAGRGASFITPAAEFLDVDGSLVVGPRHAAAGVISRRSQLRALASQQAELETRLAEVQSALTRLDQEIAEQDRRERGHAAEHKRLLDAASQNDFKIATAEQDIARIERQLAALQAEQETAQAQEQQAAGDLDAVKNRKAEAEAALALSQSALAQLAERTKTLETQRQQDHRETTETKVELVKSEERLRNLKTRLRQFEETKHERERAIRETRDQLAEAAQREGHSQGAILRIESELAKIYLQKETASLDAAAHHARRGRLQQDRANLTAEVQRARTQIRKAEERFHAKQLEANEVRHERTTLAERIREDYGVALDQLSPPASQEEEQQRDAAQQEIEELRRKLHHLGSVNLEALEELDQLESRFKTLSGQYADLVAGKNALEKILDRINVDSRRLFVETMETVKGHFQTLFRDLFGGGRADIVLDEGVDILESGIEIVARPPGKEPRNISLLSGGEKTLTCVALLLAIFRSRPSPFCVLDEVDAALDEANIDRFTKVLQDFLAWTQFIIVTHSKKTMTCANTIYGVTMQESGVSKQVSVRFEDVSEDGHIREDRLNAAKSEKASGDDHQAA